MQDKNRGTPSGSLLAQQAGLLAAYAPFSMMPRSEVQALLQGAREVYFAPEEEIFKPGQKAGDHLFIVKQGQVNALTDRADHAPNSHYEAGQMFPVGAVLSQGLVRARHVAVADTFCWQVPAATLQEVAARSVPLAQALTEESRQLLELSRKALQTALSSEVFSHFSMERPLSELRGKQPLVCHAETPLGEALQSMQSRRVGSILVCDAQERCLGILTLKDVIGKVVLPQVALQSPISSVMTSPVHTLALCDTVEDAALLMARYGVRHVPVVEPGTDKLRNIVSERDLYALQRLSLNQVSTAARHAADVEQMKGVARDIRLLARNLVSQGVQAKSLTHLISHLNDVLTERLVALMLDRHHLQPDHLCWLSFGSEGRSEQTIATDQDNGLIFVPDSQSTDGMQGQRQRWLAFARDVNEALDACGYPLCKGHIMASNPECCLTLEEWQSRFDHWIEHGSPEDLLKANIYFDLRALAGRMDLGAALRSHVSERANTVPRFLHLMAQDMLQRSVPLNWLGNIETSARDGQELVDLKLQGTAIFVDASRLRSLSLGVSATNTRERIESCAQVAGKDMKTAQARAEAFEFLQMLRLRVQMAQVDAGADAGAGVPVQKLAVAGHVPGQPNAIAVNELSDIDRKLLKESLRVARELQQEMRMDFGA